MLEGRKVKWRQRLAVAFGSFEGRVSHHAVLLLDRGVGKPLRIEVPSATGRTVQASRTL
jgi:hypothetical protein